MRLTPQDLENFLEFSADLLDDLLALGDVLAGLLPGQPLACAGDREALVVEQTPDLADQQHVPALVVAPVAPALDRLELRKLLLPVPQDVGLDPAEVADLTDGEVAFSGNRRKFVVIARFQNKPPPAP